MPTITEIPSSSSPSTKVQQAEEAKAKGNELFKKKQYAESIGFYSQAHLLDPTSPVYPLNRAAAYIALSKWADAERDCTTSIKLAPDNPTTKSYFRRAIARREQGKFDEAGRDLALVVQLDPSMSETVKPELKKLKKEREEAVRLKEIAEEKRKKNLAARAKPNGTASSSPTPASAQPNNAPKKAPAISSPPLPPSTPKRHSIPIKMNFSSSTEPSSATPPSTTPAKSSPKAPSTPAAPSSVPSQPFTFTSPSAAISQPKPSPARVALEPTVSAVPSPSNPSDSVPSPHPPLLSPSSSSSKDPTASIFPSKPKPKPTSFADLQKQRSSASKPASPKPLSTSDASSNATFASTTSNTPAKPFPPPPNSAHALFTCLTSLPDFIHLPYLISLAPSPQSSPITPSLSTIIGYSLEPPLLSLMLDALNRPANDVKGEDAEGRKRLIEALEKVERWSLILCMTEGGEERWRNATMLS